MVMNVATSGGRVQLRQDKVVAAATKPSMRKRTAPVRYRAQLPKNCRKCQSELLKQKTHCGYCSARFYVVQTTTASIR